jgi:hypothetical protein
MYTLYSSGKHETTTFPQSGVLKNPDGREYLYKKMCRVAGITR